MSRSVPGKISVPSGQSWSRLSLALMTVFSPSCVIGKQSALQELEALPSLSIFGFRDHGALLQVAGLERQSVQYDIGNPLTASKMTRHRISAGLYAPVRVLLREDTGGVAFEYDRPLTTFGQFENLQVGEIAQQLDRDLLVALETAAS